MLPPLPPLGFVPPGASQHLDVAPVSVPPVGSLAGLLAFLRELARNNNRAWMQTHAARYRTDVVSPLRLLEGRVVARVGSLVPGFCSQASGSGLLRVHRDARFIGDGPPFRTRTGIQVRHRASVPGAPAPAVTLHLEPGCSGISVGLVRAAPRTMATLRHTMRACPELFERVAASLERAGGCWLGPSERRVAQRDRAREALVPHLARACQAAWWPLDDHTVETDSLADVMGRIVRLGLPLLRYQCLALGLDPAGGGLVRRLEREGSEAVFAGSWDPRCGERMP